MSYGGGHGKFAKREGREKDKHEYEEYDTVNGGHVRSFSVKEGAKWIPFPKEEYEHD